MTRASAVVRVAGVFLAVLVVALHADPADAARRRRRAAGPPPKADRSSTYFPIVSLDVFDDPSSWRALPASGVSLALSSDSGVVGRSLRLDFDFHGGGGYAVARRELGFRLPAHYQVRFRVRGASPRNHLEFKLVDRTGDNVWWHVKREFEFTPDWRAVTIRKRQIEFAWGPRGGGELDSAAAVEFAITAGEGGRGTVWLDELELIPLAPPPAVPPPVAARASSFVEGREPVAVLDTLATTVWECRGGGEQWLALDFGAPREFGGLTLDWLPGKGARDYQIETSFDGTRWDTLRTVYGGDGGRDALWLPDNEARHLRVRLFDGESPIGYAMRRLDVKPVDWAASRAEFFKRLAADAPRGTYPRGFTEQVYWAVIGDPNSDHEALLSEDGAIECGKAQFSIEPFVRVGDSLYTWADVRTEQLLSNERTPDTDRDPRAGASPEASPVVRWTHPRFTLEVRASARGARITPRWELRNTSRDTARAELLLALRPFQVNPPMQFLNQPGGTALVSRIEWQGDSNVVRVDGTPRLWWSSTVRSGAASFDEGGIDPHRLSAALGRSLGTSDPFRAASAMLAPLPAVPPGQAGIATCLVSLRADGSDDPTAPAAPRPPFQLELPAEGAELARTVEANLDWIAINRDGPAIQPGSRSYERSWIRDGSLTSTALLRTGRSEDVRRFLEWFASFEYGDGKVPCCVDRRGADPVPENDSHGQLIYLAAEYLRHTGDEATLRSVWPTVAKAARYLDSLRLTHRTAEYRAADRREFFGLLPASISHEGYSAKPMHSYWDDLFGLRGLTDAAWLAQRFGTADERSTFAADRDTFRADVIASLERAMAKHRIDYLPGCAELGDFDATSTTVALSPVDAGHVLPRAALERTFERYWGFFLARRDSGRAWDGFTPYEIRNVGAFIHLGWKDRAHELLAWFMEQRRPAGWRQWPEVVYADPRAARFLGDLPHTWVGSDFIRSTLDLIAFERAADSALVIGAGIPERWARDAAGLRVAGLSTHYGRLSLTSRPRGDAVEYALDLVAGRPADGAGRSGSRAAAVPGGLVVRSPLAKTREIRVDGKPVAARDEVVVRSLPATVTFR